MSIDFRKYVRIQSGVGGAAVVASRDLMGRILTNNPLTPADAPLEFGTAAEVSAYYGAGTLEARIAAFYFSYVSPTISAPKRISFGRYAPSGSSARLIGNTSLKPLTSFTAINTGTLALAVDGAPLSVPGIDLSGAASLADVATTVQTAISATTELANATVAYDAVSRRFTVTAAGLTTSRVEIGATTPLSTALGWDTGAVVSPAVQPQTASAAFVQTMQASDNFGSVALYPAPSLDDSIQLAASVAAENVKFQLMLPVSRADAETWAASLAGYAGVALTLSPVAGEFPELFPMIQLAATNYGTRNGVVNYMFRQIGGLTPSVRTTPESDLFDSFRVNYYGLTKSAGFNYAFYQRGLLMGGPTAPLDMNVHANEQWLKDRVGADLMTLLLSAGRVPANEEGRGQVLNAIQQGIDLALINGTISVGKVLTQAQRASVTELSGDALAWQQVEQQGYWINCAIEQFVGPSGVPEYRAVYLLIYSKDDAIRSVDGRHQLV